MFTAVAVCSPCFSPIWSASIGTDNTWNGLIETALGLLQYLEDFCHKNEVNTMEIIQFSGVSFYLVSFVSAAVIDDNGIVVSVWWSDACMIGCSFSLSIAPLSDGLVSVLAQACWYSVVLWGIPWEAVTVFVYNLHHGKPICLSYQFDGLAQGCGNSSAFALELLESCAKQSNYYS